MPVTFDKLEVGQSYGRPELARVWGYRRYNAIARGVITPKGDNKIVLFITRQKQPHLTQYEDSLERDVLAIEGERNHISDDRIIAARKAGDAIHLFFRERHHTKFIYHGQVTLTRYERNSAKPSRFWFLLPTRALTGESTLLTEQETHADLSQFHGSEEGRKRLIQSYRYERSGKNRAAALAHHGTICKACGFDFDKVYGAKHARHYIEIHHVASVTRGVRKINPITDLIPLCSNCHSMAHRRSGSILSLSELKALLRPS